MQIRYTNFSIIINFMKDCLFCEFVSSKKDHNNGFPYLTIHETKNTVSFLSINFPMYENGHTLVITKDHYANLEDVPAKVQHELVEHVSLICKAVRKKHEACNVLLNNGKVSGQSVFHVHFHIIPRDKGDNIEVEVWKKAKLTEKRFIEITNRLKKRVENILQEK